MISLLGLERGGGGGHGGGGHGGGGHGGSHGHGGHHGGGRRGGGGGWAYGPDIWTATPACPQVYAPVIGTDGLTYDNACYAQVAGVSIARVLSGLGDANADCIAACNTAESGPSCFMACPAPTPIALPLWLRALMMASAGASAYHGYKRNNGSIGWAIGWGLLGGLFPVITPAIAVAEGYGKPKKG